MKSSSHPLPPGISSFSQFIYFCFCFFVLFIFFLRNPDATREENIWSGIVSLAVVFLVLSLLVMPNGEFDQHPTIIIIKLSSINQGLVKCVQS